MLGFAILLAFNVAGVLLQQAGVPLPGNVIGLLLFTVALFLRWIRLEWVEGAASFLLEHMLLFFAPIIVGVVTVVPLIRGEWLSVAVSLILSTLIGLLAAGGVVKLTDQAK